jgi:hypothetical protein
MDGLLAIQPKTRRSNAGGLISQKALEPNVKERRPEFSGRRNL